MKVGDKVRIREDAAIICDQRPGDIGTISDIKRDQIFVDTPNGVSGWYWSDELESATPVVPDYGVSPDELARYVKDFIEAAQARVTGVGAEQYSNGSSQKFETMNVLELLTYAREEAQDLAVYAAMLDIRFARLAEQLKKAGVK